MLCPSGVGSCDRKLKCLATSETRVNEDAPVDYWRPREAGKQEAAVARGLGHFNFREGPRTMPE
jgi:hypothetical protein